MNTNLEIHVRTVYGNETIYPANDVARHFAAIAGTKTLLPKTLRSAQALGFTVSVVPNVSELLATVLR
jgi:2-keto-3-deoxy-6-phosphogluconate aldolase